MIKVHITTNPRAGSIEVGTARHELATWHNGGEGLLLGTTTDGQRVTLATEAADDEGSISGALCIGNTMDAPRWAIRNARKEGRTLEGMAFAVPCDGEMEKMFPGCEWGETA